MRGSNKSEHAVQHGARPLRRLRQLVVERGRGKSETPRYSACGPLSSIRTSNSVTNAEVVKLETNDDGSAVTGVVVKQGRGDEDLHGRPRGRSRAAPRTPPKLLLPLDGSDKHPNSQADGSDQVRRNYMFHNSLAVLALSHHGGSNRLFPEDPPASTTSLAGNGHDYPLGNIQMVGHSQAPMFRGERPGDEARAQWETREGREARDQLLALDRGPAAAREPRHVDNDAQADAQLPLDERHAETNLQKQLHSMGGKLRGWGATTSSTGSRT